jgi:hypothetical protein
VQQVFLNALNRDELLPWLLLSATNTRSARSGVAQEKMLWSDPGLPDAARFWSDSPGATANRRSSWLLLSKVTWLDTAASISRRWKSRPSVVPVAVDGCVAGLIAV